MSDEKTTPPAETTPPPSTPAPLTGSAAFEAQLDGLKPEPTQTAAPAAKTSPAKPDAAKPASKETTSAPVIAPKGKPAPTAATLDWKTAPAEFRTAHQKLIQESQQTSAQREAEVARLNTRLSELDKRKYLTPEQEAEYQKKDERLQQIESNLYSRDYRESPDYERDFKIPWQDKYMEAMTEVKALNVKYTENDEERTRPATKADFDSLLEIKTKTGRAKLAKQIFGDDDGPTIADFAKDLDAIVAAGEKMIKAKGDGFNQEKQKFAANREANKAAGKTAYDEYTALLSQKYPEHFAEDAANPEASTAMKSGLDYVDSITNSINSVSPQEGAKNAAVVRMMAGAWGRNQVVIKQLKAQLEGKELELAKYRKSAPGGEEGGSGDGGTKPKGGGSDALAMSADKLMGE